MSEQLRYLDGPQVSLETMLKTRDWRAERQLAVLKTNPQSTLIWLSTRIPGPVKTGTHLTAKYQAIAQGIMNKYGANVVDAASYQRDTGFEFYIAVTQSPIQVKRDLVTFEQQTRFGQLCDLDVLYLSEGRTKQVGRQQLALPRRTCLVCGDDAKICSRSQRHDLATVQSVVDEIISEGWREV